jgi:hypothetical protein
MYHAACSALLQGVASRSCDQIHDVQMSNDETRIDARAVDARRRT